MGGKIERCGGQNRANDPKPCDFDPQVGGKIEHRGGQRGTRFASSQDHEARNDVIVGSITRGAYLLLATSLHK